jgi:putative peptidoglycan binding protein
MHRMIELDPTLALAVSAVDAPPVPQPPPIGVGGGAHDTLWLQDALNKCGADPKLLVDGNYGRGTRAAVTAFQNQAGITADGLAGPQTFGVLETKLASLTALRHDRERVPGPWLRRRDWIVKSPSDEIEAPVRRHWNYACARKPKTLSKRSSSRCAC